MKKKLVAMLLVLLTLLPPTAICADAVYSADNTVPAIFHSDFGEPIVYLCPGFDFINTPSSKKNLNLALSGATLSGQVYYTDEAANLMKELGYDKASYIYHNDDSGSAFMNPVSCFGYKRTYDQSGKAVNVFAIAVRGTRDLEADVPTDLIDGLFTMFDTSRGHVMDDFHDFLKNEVGKTVTQLKKETNYFFLTGHSMGGAVANALSVDGEILELAGNSKDRIYTYTFESPHTCVNLWWTDPEGESNAFNFKTYGDSVTDLPGYMGATTYGKDVVTKPGTVSGSKAMKELFPNLSGKSQTEIENYSLHDRGWNLASILVNGMEEGLWYSASDISGYGGGTEAWRKAYIDHLMQNRESARLVDVGIGYPCLRDYLYLWWYVPGKGLESVQWWSGGDRRTWYRPGENYILFAEYFIEKIDWVDACGYDYTLGKVAQGEFITLETGIAAWTLSKDEPLKFEWNGVKMDKADFDAKLDSLKSGCVDTCAEPADQSYQEVIWQLRNYNGSSANLTSDSYGMKDPPVDSDTPLSGLKTGTFGGHTYCVFDLHTGWDEAKAYCQSLGGHLATISSAQEDRFLYQFMGSSGYESAFFGFTDEAAEGDWRWVTGEGVTYTNWEAKEPNAETAGENYGMYAPYYSGQWNDLDYGNGGVTAFLCEWDFVPDGVAAAEAYGVHFNRVNVYSQDQFSDVPANQWYTPGVSEAFQLGLMKGHSDTAFNPYGDVTLAEAITMAARLHSIYTTGSESFRQTGAWYQVYLDYAYQNGIISLAYYNCDVSQKASRAQFAEIFARALPDDALPGMNTVKDGAIPDVKVADSFGAAVYQLYRAGILTGSDANGTFNPQTYITRAEAAAIVSRMAESGNRVPITLDGTGTPESDPAAADPLVIYDSLLKAYRAAVNKEREWDSNLGDPALYNIYTAYYPKAGYAFLDINEDGVPEMLTGPTSPIRDFGNGLIYDLYTYRDGAVVKVTQSAERSRYHLLENGQIGHEWSNGASDSGVDYYILEKGAADLKITKSGPSSAKRSIEFTSF